MLQTQHKSRTYTTPKLSRCGSNGSESDISATAREAFSWSAFRPGNDPIRIRTAIDSSIDQTLRAIDAYRSPLAEKKLRGEKLTKRETNELKIWDELLGMFVEQPTSLPKEAEWALREAERLLGIK